jgi:DNA-3-methyladenine glycosylase II
MSYPAGRLRGMDPVHVALLPATAPFSLGASLRALAGFAPATGDHVVTGDTVRTALVRPDSPSEAVVVEVSPHLLGEPGVTLRVFAARVLEPAQARAVERDVSRWLSLADDLRPFLARARRDLALAPVLAVTEGLHQVRFRSLAEGAVYFALTQRSTQWYAAARKRRLVQRLGPRLVVDGIEHIAFPALSTLAALAPAELVEFAGNATRAQRLARMLGALAGLDEEWLRTAEYPLARATLLAIPGIGDFTAHAVLLRVLGRPDDAPLEMAQFRSAAEAVYGAAPPSATELREWYAPYVGWWGYYTRTALGWLGRAPHSSEQPERAAA